jgi:hypothetical protein
MHSRHPPGPSFASSAAAVATSSTIAVALPPPTPTLPPSPPLQGSSRVCCSHCCCCCTAIGVGTIIVTVTITVSVAIALACLGQHGIAQYKGSAVSLGEKVDMSFVAVCNFSDYGDSPLDNGRADTSKFGGRGLST